jgi:hypothetical protein
MPRKILFVVGDVDIVDMVDTVDKQRRYLSGGAAPPFPSGGPPSEKNRAGTE